MLALHRMIQVQSLLQANDSPTPASEIFHNLLEHPSGTRIEQILSHGQASPAGFWYDQPQDEWVLLLQGQAELEIEGQPMLSLHTGDHVCIPAHLKHRVHSTSKDTRWLAVHLGAK
jgi:cupin 2 domain-containing protein